MSRERPAAGPGRVAAVILAAGKGKRMGSDISKVMHELAGQPLLGHVLDRLDELGIDERVAIVGFGREPVIALCEARGTRWVVQEEQLGTGHAFQQAVPALDGFHGTVLVLCGDMALLTRASLRSLLDTHRSRGATATVLSADLADPGSYGRVVRDAGGDIERIVEAKDATPAELALAEVNTAIYAFEYPDVLEVLGGLTAENRQGEYYLTDVVGLLRRRGRRVAVVKVADPREALGVNTQAQLAEVEAAYGALRAAGRL
jgi:bifunctional UDP-N-acetylglucosamine pyrophosphorylase / glucosamine-1-phosphate N-acetyltransferase